MSVGPSFAEGTLPDAAGYRRAIRRGTGDHDPRNRWSRCPESAITTDRNERSRSAGIGDQDGSEYATEEGLSSF